MSRWLTQEQIDAHQAKYGVSRVSHPAYKAQQEARNKELSALVQRMPTKYRNKKTDGYASRREAERAAALKMEEGAGLISHLSEQVRYELIPAQYIDGKCIERAVTYTADFVYCRGGEMIVEDVKSPASRTQQYVIRRKLMLYIHGIRVRETR